MFLNKKIKIFLNYFVGPVIFIWLSYSIYRQIQQQGDVHQSWRFIIAALTGPQAWKLVLVSILMLLHLGIEAVKWTILMRNIQPVSFARAYRAVFSGQALAFNTPNRLGESAGRAVYLEEGNRLRGIILSVVGSMSQNIVTFVVGLLALLYLRLNILGPAYTIAGMSIFWYNALVFMVTVGTGFFIIIYFRIVWAIKIVEKISFVKKHRFLVQKLEDFHWRELTNVLFLSFCRYVIYLVQYVLLLQVFEVHVAVLNAACMTGVVFLVITMIPTIALAELGFRGKVSLQLFGLLSTNTVGIIATAAGIWIINLIIPAIAGSLLLLGIRLFRIKMNKAK